MSRGLHRKYNVTRTDGSDQPGRKHYGCAYFVLDLGCDPHALVALAAYRDSVLKSNPSLARDIMELIRSQEHKDDARCSCREVGCPHSLGQALMPGAEGMAHELMNKAGKR